MSQCLWGASDTKNLDTTGKLSENDRRWKGPVERGPDEEGQDHIKEDC